MGGFPLLVTVTTLWLRSFIIAMIHHMDHKVSTPMESFRWTLKKNNTSLRHQNFPRIFGFSIEWPAHHRRGHAGQWNRQHPKRCCQSGQGQFPPTLVHFAFPWPFSRPFACELNTETKMSSLKLQLNDVWRLDIVQIQPTSVAYSCSSFLIVRNLHWRV